MVIQKLKEIFENHVAGKQNADGESVDRTQLAVCVLLLAIAHSDDRYDQSEEEQIVEILKEHFRLQTQHTLELLELARRKHRESVDLFRFTNIINTSYSRAEKERVAEILWQVVYADNRLSAFEDNLIHRLSRMLNLSHYQLIEAKKKVKGWK